MLAFNYYLASYPYDFIGFWIVVLNDCYLGVKIFIPAFLNTTLGCDNFILNFNYCTKYLGVPSMSVNEIGNN